MIQLFGQSKLINEEKENNKRQITNNKRQKTNNKRQIINKKK